MIYTHVLKVGGAGVRSPLDALCRPLTSEVGQRKSWRIHYPCAKAIGAASNGRLRKVLLRPLMAGSSPSLPVDQPPLL